ncbi:hypothetical protein L3Q82_005034 [Scortum barcoo]|uniref:Uncharacterized protein n=1 Tax=Scortum barcoo TaxID=214431 RepID=A0ACB8VDZ9_9TELE|nr:hypothetical protein L3Q82_005034 [Scortum barcoo]
MTLKELKTNSMHQRPSVPTHQRGLSSLADVTHPASVIERDANPAPLQSLAVGWGGTGRDIGRDTRKEVGSVRRGSAYGLWASRGIFAQTWTSEAGFALEAKSLAEGSAEGECCGSCSPPPAPPLVSPVLTVEESGFTTVELCQDEEDICLTTSEGEMEEMCGQDPNCEDMQRKDQRLPFQIFPNPVEVVLGPETTLNSLDHDHEKERLPSIVVEPTEVSEVESGELRWPPENMDMEEDEEDLFLEQCIPPANIADWGDEEEEEETSVILNQQQGLTLIGTDIT